MSKRLLVVEDLEDLRAILRDLLSASDYTVIEVVDGVEGAVPADQYATLLSRMRTILCGVGDKLMEYHGIA